uniref:Uncharacterized protein n=1 Tax=Tanacetum cinerariifolium TaxID=118510 RepID=A0A699HMN5_TANCI|nr:hypothetical protein [Tanacetum cinerariifolium]
MAILEGEGLSLDEEEAVPEGQHHAVLVVDIAVSEPLGLGYRVARRRALESIEEIAPSTFTIILVVPSPKALPMATSATTISVDKDQFIKAGMQLELHGSILHDHTQRLDALPPTLVVDINRDVRELYTRSRRVRDEIFLQRYRFRSLKQEQERATVILELCGGQYWHWRQRQGMLIPEWKICHRLGCMCLNTHTFDL